MIAREHCQQKLGVFGITDYSPHCPKSAELQPTDYSQDSWLQSSWCLEAQYISMVIGDRHSFLSSRLLPPFDTVSVIPTAYRHFTVHRLMSSDFIEQLLHRNKQIHIQLQTLITVGLALLMTHKQNKYRKSSHSMFIITSELVKSF